MIEGRLLNSISLNTLTGISKKLIKKLGNLGLSNVQDLLLHLPIRYKDYTKLYPIGKTIYGMSVTVKGEVFTNNISYNRKPMLTCRLRDDSGVLTLRFFNFNKAIKNSLSPGQWITACGKIRHGKFGKEMIHPEYHVQQHERYQQDMLDKSLVPIYPTTEGLSQSMLRNMITQALKLLTVTPVAELLPPEFSCNMMSLSDALHTLHRPSSDISLTDLELGRHPAQYRLIMEELLAHNLSLLALRDSIQNRALPLCPNINLIRCFLASLPFAPTNAQKRVITEIYQDLALHVPMMRLVQGDVGSGKTLVAALAALLAISAGQQVAMMVPTELLAEQHAQNFRNWFSPLGIEVGWLTGKQKGKMRKIQQQAIADGKVAMIIGTHAIFQKKVRFANLALVIIDEQHRFGVHQRLAFLEKGLIRGFYPHQLIMTATPIPRTLAMTVYADLDTSVINELPMGRKPVTTVAIPDTRRLEIIQRVRHACLKEQRQGYWVCTLIEDSDLQEAQAAEATLQELQNASPELRIGLLHGRMKEQDKQRIMKSFKTGEIQLLVATTAIEVGINVPNASLIIIENPERLGLAQLHQLRGRVGRSTVISHCVLLYKSPLSKTAKVRLQVLRNSNDGFIIAQRDLEIRGPGELQGTRQTGNPKFRMVNLLRDQAIIPEVYHLACYIHTYLPDLANALIERWMPERVHYTNA